MDSTNYVYNGNEIAKELGIAIRQPLSIEYCRGLVIERQLQYERYKSPLLAVDIDDFFILINNAIVDAEEKAGIPEKYRPWFSHEFPDVGASEDNDGVSEIDKSLDGIIYRVMSRSPAPMSGPIESGVKIQYKPTPREKLHVNSNDYDVEQWGMWMRTIVEFECFSTKNRIADKRALWFEDLIFDYLWYFQMHGVEVVYRERLTDRVDTTKKQPYYCKPITYWIRTEKIYHKLLKKLDSVNVRYDIGTSLETIQYGDIIYQQLKGLHE